ncbi:MAG TPA: hypothetical protein VHM19_20850, partial [Polyangiales bacterium]|nr:hypothetical protein [Polyangiales bacterium]
MTRVGTSKLAIGMVCAVLCAGIGCSSDDASKSKHDAGGVSAMDAGRLRDAGSSHDAAEPRDSGVTSGRADAAADGGGSHEAGGSHDAAIDGGVHSPRDVCKPGASYGAPLSSTTLTATKIDDHFTFSEGAVWLAEPGVLLFSDILPGAGADNVQ